jgi:conjugal transfer ATP-binding protein TraC
VAQNWKKKLTAVAHDLLDWVKPDAPGHIPLTLAEARGLVDRDRFTDLLSFRFFDAEDDLCYLDEGEGLAIGFGFALSPMVLAGSDAETQLEAAINSLPPDSVVQFSVLSSPQVEGFLNVWANSRLEKNTNPLLKQVALRRREFMLKTAVGPSMLPKSRMHPRMMQYYALIRIPFKGDIEDEAARATFVKSVKDVRSSFQSALKGGKVHADLMNEEDFRFLMRELLNPHLDPKERLTTAQPQVPLHLDLLDRNTRLVVGENSVIGFGSGEGESDVLLSSITVDAKPRFFTLPMMSQTLGSPLSWDERITCPFWSYTTIHVLDAENAKDALTTKLGLLNRQTMSESAWYRAMMKSLYERKDMADQLLTETRKGHRLVRAYAGINVYAPQEEIREQTELVKGLWRKAGFRVSEEKYIGLPVFIASLPFQYNSTMDPPNRGLQRAALMHSLNAASLIPIQGDWSGTMPQRGGPLMVSRRGQLATFDLLQTSVNYNFVIVATSGSGKSFFANEIVCDFLSKGGNARLIDVGRSYHRFCTVMGGQNIVFSPDNPMSLNPFSDIHDEEGLSDAMPVLKDMLRQMMYPVTPEDQTPPWEYAMIEESLNSAWRLKRAGTELKDVHEFLLDHPDPRAKDMAFMLAPWATGRYARWFSGRRTVSFDNPLVVIELEELKTDPQLQAVVMSLVIHQVTTEMYLGDRKLPKLLAIDEAWDLLGGLRTGKFIEAAFRRARKYNGIAGIITQSFEDFEKSPAAKAAIENAAWQFILYQRKESLDFAMANKRIVGGEAMLELLRTVRSGDGFSEIYVRGESGEGLYRFVTDRHSYYTFTTNPRDINRLNDLRDRGVPLIEAIDTLAREDYRRTWGDTLAIES